MSTHYRTPNKSPGPSGKKTYIGRDNSPHKQYHAKCLCEICTCPNPHSSHKCPVQKPSNYPADLESTAHHDYNKVNGWQNPNTEAHLMRPVESLARTAALPSTYTTEYISTYKGSPSKVREPFTPAQKQQKSPAPDFGTTYTALTSSSKKPSYVPLNRASQAPPSPSRFHSPTEYNDRYVPHPNPPREINGYGGYSGTPSKGLVNGSQELKTTYQTVHTPPPNEYKKAEIVKPSGSNTLPRVNVTEKESVYMREYKGKHGNTRNCPVEAIGDKEGRNAAKMMLETLKARAGDAHVEFDADWGEWKGRK